MKIRFITLFSVIFLLLAISAFAALDLKFNNTININPASPSDGTTVSFSVMFMPSGAAVDNLKCTWGVDGTVIGQKTFGHLNANASTGLSFDWTATSGNHTAWFELDPDHLLGDSNYTNNRIEKSFTVGGGSPAGQPDLAPIVVYSPVKFNANDDVKFEIIIYNTGSVISKLCNLQIIQNGSVIETKIVPGILPAGGKIPNNNHWHLNYTWKAVCGAAMEIRVDSNNINNETNEANNSWLNTMNCKLTMHDGFGSHNPVLKIDPNGPDLTVKILGISRASFDSSGNTAVVSFEVSNIGKAPSVPCQMTAKRGGVDEMYFDIPALAVGQKFSKTYAEEFVCKQETSLQIDVDNKNIESNESNNIAKKKILCFNNPK